MKPEQAAAEIITLLQEGERRGAPAPSAALTQFLRRLSESKNSATLAPQQSNKLQKRVGSARARLSEAEMSSTIDQIAAKLRAAFPSDAAFEALITEPTVQSLSKPNVVALFNRVFDTSRTFPKAVTKPDLFNAMRRERISRVRGMS